MAFSTKKTRDLMKQMEEKKNKNSGNRIALGVTFGSALGVVFGIVFKNISFGIAMGASFGAALGVAFGAIFDFAKNRA